MIKVLLKTFAVLSLLLCGVNLYASDREEAVAPWESAAEGRLWSERVISDTLSAAGNKMPLNALCDETAFKTIKLLKEKAVSKLQLAKREGRKTYSAQLYAGILKNISEIDIAPLKDNEQELLSRVSPLQFSLLLMDSLSAGKSQKQEIASLPAAAAIWNSGHFKHKEKNNKASIFSRADVKDHFCNVNLNDYSFKSAKIDFYNLYLYIWEDNPLAEGSKNIQPSSFPYARSFFKTEQIPLKNIFYSQSLKILKGVASC